MTESVKAPRRRPRLKGQAALEVVEVWWLTRPLPDFDSGWGPTRDVPIADSDSLPVCLTRQGVEGPDGCQTVP
jgi:hypothetical protein